ncbi:MAG: DNA-protecting protein DprA [Bacilli bacterium]|nr:DNA-protecting protein DprA [Bacilli bacterium]
MNSRDLLIAMAVHYQGDERAIINALLRKDIISDELAESHLKSVKSNVMTILDPDYPSYLKEVYFPPLVLFYYGDISLIYSLDDNVAVVGGRKPSPEGASNVYYIVQGICRHYNIVSGLARGIDSIAHRASLENGGKTIAVLANGIDFCYPTENSELYEIIKKNNLVISEYYGTVPPDKTNFHQRNRLITAFAKCTIIGEARKISGTLITANYTLNMNRTLMSIPSGNILDSLPNELIKEGCPILTEPNDVLMYLNDEKKSLLCDVK